TSASTFINVTNPPSCNIVEPSHSICEGSSSSFTAVTVPGASYSWTGPGGFTAFNESTGPITVGGVYTLTVSLNGCTSTCTRTLTVNPRPATPTPTHSSPVCAGGNLT